MLVELGLMEQRYQAVLECSTIHWVQLDAGVVDNDHYIDPEERLRIAMARQ